MSFPLSNLTLTGSPTVLQAAWISAFAAVIGYLSNVIYHFWVSPLSSIPGPKLAILVPYWSTIKWIQGDLTPTIKDFHFRHKTTLIRIGRNQVAAWGVKAYREIYAEKRFLKDGDFYQAIDGFYLGDEAHSVVTLSDPAQHRHRRQILSPLFSRQSILKLEELIHEKVYHLASKIEEHVKLYGSVDILLAIRSTTVDIISVFAFGQALGALDYPHFSHPFLLAFTAGFPALMARVSWPKLVDCVRFFPTAMVPKAAKDMGRMMKVISKSLETHIDSRCTTSPYPIIFANLLESIPRPSLAAIETEAFSFLGAGVDTTAYTCTEAVYRISNDETIVTQLLGELCSVAPSPQDKVSLQELEKLPYLTACVKEALRIAPPAPGLMPRIISPGGWDFESVHLPAGTIVGGLAMSVNHDSEIFHEPLVFKPERWLDADGKFDNTMDANLMTFSKGPRQCLGINLAYAEVYLIVASLIRRFEFTLHPTMRAEDMSTTGRCYFGAMPARCQMLVKKREF